MRIGMIGVQIMLVIFALAGCTRKKPIQPPAVEAGAFKVAIVLPRAIETDSWSESGYQGLKLIEQKLGAQVAYTENVEVPPHTNAEEVLRQYATQGFDLAIAHGGQFEAALETVAKEFPRTKFALVGGYPGNNKNLGGLGFRVGELSYLLGAIAAMKSQSGKIGTIGGQAVANTVDIVQLYERGAKAIDRDIEVATAWVNSWTDLNTAQQLAEDMIEADVDVILANAGKGNRAIYEVAAAHQAYTLGWPGDQYDLAPNTMLTSGIQRVPLVLLEAAILVRQGRWEGKQYRFGFDVGAHDLAPFRGALTPGEIKRVNSIKRDILIHKIDAFP